MKRLLEELRIEADRVMNVFFCDNLVVISIEKNLVHHCETKVWLILILMITKQGLELMIIFKV